VKGGGEGAIVGALVGDAEGAEVVGAEGAEVGEVGEVGLEEVEVLQGPFEVGVLLFEWLLPRLIHQTSVLSFGQGPTPQFLLLALLV